ncbi:class I SAM-dependent methyltransferase [Magnetofaba australis]|uniref:Putative Methyltransferase type 11 n=1 Tax=Magnetofaba australis IT-1 TaxID=1434232 RepID=A0A1Y2K3I2_9PROT|nr:class I SAM-dependent methyltransferase [Magnetofaba australis]OSM02237.1 putative Methyltransferase type 11 [Magnetofaba australis IT-1]
MSEATLADWMIPLLRCPLHPEQALSGSDVAALHCPQCAQAFPLASNGDGQTIADLRALGQPSSHAVTFHYPMNILDNARIAALGRATRAEFDAPQTWALRKVYASKLHKEILYYIEQFRRDFPSDAPILDLGCGGGGNADYLAAQGLTHVLRGDFDPAARAHLLLDAHRLPFADASFDAILTTAVIEHLQNPFLAFYEMSRVLKPGGRIIATGSFWESWHGGSCFHFTPEGLHQLCQHAGLALDDIWSGWGFIPAVMRHALRVPHSWRPFTYRLQSAYDWWLTRRQGVSAPHWHRMKTSGSFGVHAIKPQE